MPKARIKLPPELDGLLRTDMERVIREANMGKEDTIIAKRYFISIIPQADISAELKIDRSTVSKRLKKITRKMEETARRMNYKIT